MLDYFIILLFIFGATIGMIFEHHLNRLKIKKLATKWHKDAFTFYGKNDPTADMIRKYTDEMEAAQK